MKTFKLHHLLLSGSLFLASCATVNYLGDQYTPTAKTDVYYDAKDIKQEYKVIGHLSAAYNSAEKIDVIKNKLSDKAKTIGADAIIILQTTGNSDHEMLRADAIKYGSK
jgi:hypothetical protein